MREIGGNVTSVDVRVVWEPGVSKVGPIWAGARDFPMWIFFQAVGLWPQPQVSKKKKLTVLVNQQLLGFPET